MREPIFVVGFFLLGSFVAACDPTASPDLLERENAGWSDDQAWTLREVLRLGTVGGTRNDPQQFGSIASVALDSRERVYVLDHQAQEIRVFSLTGKFLYAIGRPGSGPGEFEFARSMALSPGDTLVVRDDATMRYSVFGPDGELLATHRRDIVGTNSGATPAWVDGRYIDWAPHTPDGRFGARFSLLPIAYSPDFATADTLAPIEHMWTMLPNNQPMPYYSGVPLGALSSTGGVWVANSKAYEIHLRTPGGDTLRSLRLDVDPLPLGEDEIAELRDRLARSPEYLALVLEALPETQPPLEALASDDMGHLYAVPNTSRRPSGTALDVFSSGGDFLGSMSIPDEGSVAALDGEGFRVYQDHVLIVRRDELEVPFVVLYEIRRPR